MKTKIYKNGTPYSDKEWKQWYAHKSNKELWIEQQEAEEERLADMTDLDNDPDVERFL